jgi:hypothetical protein
MPKRTKAEIVREYLLKFPEMRPTEMARRILDENKGLKLRIQEISTIKGKMKKDGTFPPASVAPERKPAPATPQKQASAAPQSPGMNLADRLARLKEAADAVGGPEAAKRILDLMK